MESAEAPLRHYFDELAIAQQFRPYQRRKFADAGAC